ncbi:MAG: hypothetical protein KKD99_02510 [Proteobacteria bacterium]|nr:hypothetical protein [Pseudomonadota bacterium]MBU4357107.1 hypothetical protein [Pseudomonadota bacterium]MBU4447433.1 hypothetical protein [Pseudomonadota bacterium]MCG2772229.1 hypothetical protein [Desulfobacterales bacterium]
MSKLKKKIESELKEVIEEGKDILLNYADKPPLSISYDVMVRYQGWYTRALVLIKEIIPHRLEEFICLYSIGNRKSMDLSTYGIKEYLFCLSFTNANIDDLKHTMMNKFTTQLSILASAVSQLDNILNNINKLVQAELFDNEIEAACELLRANHLRAAGTIAGVILERHLYGICNSRGIDIEKKNPSIAELNDKLKEEGFFDVPTWRRIQHLGDLRNYCCHQKERDPTKDEVEEMIRSVEKITKTIK